jgi:hypothetical protein
MRQKKVKEQWKMTWIGKEYYKGSQSRVARLKANDRRKEHGLQRL